MPASDEPAPLATLPAWWQVASEWLDENCSPVFGCVSFYIAGAYAMLAILTLVQLIRIQVREPVCKGTKNRLFLLVSFALCSLRALTFGLYWSPILANELVVFDIPALAFLFAYCTLVSDFADLYHGEKYKEEADRLLNSSWDLKTFFKYVTVPVCAGWVIIGATKILVSIFARHPLFLLQGVSAGFLVLISSVSVIAFLVYGYLLLIKRQEFSEEYKNFKNLLLIGIVTILGSIFFAIRTLVHGIITIFPDDQRFHPLPAIVFCLILSEIILAYFVLSFFRELPKPKSWDPDMHPYEAV